MSVRKEDQSYIDQMRDIQERLRKLESSQNNAVRKNDIRLSNVIVTANDTPLELCLQDLTTKQSVCIGAQTLQDPPQAMWSFSGPLTSGDEGTLSPPYSVERDTVARQIVLARNFSESFTGTVIICVSFNNGATIMRADLPAASRFTTTEINVPLLENAEIRCELIDAATNAENISVFVRFGTPTVSLSFTDCAF